MNHKHLLISTIFGMMLIMGFSIPSASGLSCGIPAFTESFERHDLLLHGKLVEKNIPFGLSNKHTTLIFETIKVYKGEFSDTFTIKADLSWDDYYREGEVYVLFADMDGDNYRRELCVPDYIATPTIIKFLDNPIKDPEVRVLYLILSESESEEVHKKMTAYSKLNRAEIRIDEYENKSMILWNILQILIILAIVGIASYFIYRRIKK